MRPSAEKISKIAEVLQVTTDYLLDDSKDSPIESDRDQAFFRKFSKLDPEKKTQLEAILKVLDDD